MSTEGFRRLFFFLNSFGSPFYPLSSSGLLLAGGQAICTFIELLSMWNLTRIEVQLCNLLSPEAPPLSLASYNWCLVSVFCFLLNIAEIVYTKFWDEGP